MKDIKDMTLQELNELEQQIQEMKVEKATHLNDIPNYSFVLTNNNRQLSPYGDTFYFKFDNKYYTITGAWNEDGLISNKETVIDYVTLTNDIETIKILCNKAFSLV